MFDLQSERMILVPRSRLQARRSVNRLLVNARAVAGNSTVWFTSFSLGLFLAGATGMGLWVTQKQNAAELSGKLVYQQNEASRLERRTRELKETYLKLQSEEIAWRGRVVQLKDQVARTQLAYTRIREQLGANRIQADQVESNQKRMAEELELLRKEKRDHLAQAETFQDENQDLERKVKGLRNQLALVDRDYRKLSTEIGIEPEAAWGGVPLTQQGAFASAKSVLVAREQTGELDPFGSSTGAFELDPVVVGSRSGYSPPIEGAVMKVNLSHQFIVLDKGSGDGVQEGMVFDIKRDGEWLGRIKTVMVEQGVAACDILSSKEDAVFRIGDVAVLSGS